MSTNQKTDHKAVIRHQRDLILTQPLAPMIDRWVQEHKDEMKEQGGQHE